MKKSSLLIIAMICIALLAGCENVTQPQMEELSPEEIARANDALVSLTEIDGVYRASEVSCFFTSFYDKTEEINFAEFLRYFPIRERLEDTDSEEYASVLDMMAIENPDVKQSPSMLAPIYRYRKEDISAILKKYANITIDDLASTDGVIYLEKYDAFYNTTSDFAPGIFECVSGKTLEDMVYLFSAADTNGNRIQLILTAADGEYYIQSFQKEILLK